MRSLTSGVISVVFLALGLTQPALAAGGEGADEEKQASTLELTYDLYVGGIPLGRASMSARIQGEDYKAISTLETKGIVTALWQAKIEASSSGVLADGRVQPSLYDSFSQNRSTPRRHSTLSFGPEGPKTIILDPPYGNNNYPVSNALQKKTLDPLSAVISLISSASAKSDKPCDATAPIFDGRRRYDVAFKFLRKTNVHMDNNLYSGPALMCEIHYNQIAGYQPSVLEEGKRFPKLYAWVISAQSPGDPARHYMLPLRVWAETDYGIVVALASQAKLDGMSVSKSS